MAGAGCLYFLSTSHVSLYMAKSAPRVAAEGKFVVWRSWGPIRAALIDRLAALQPRWLQQGLAHDVKQLHHSEGLWQKIFAGLQLFRVVQSGR